MFIARILLWQKLFILIIQKIQKSVSHIKTRKTMDRYIRGSHSGHSCCIQDVVKTLEEINAKTGTTGKYLGSISASVGHIIKMNETL